MSWTERDDELQREFDQQPLSERAKALRLWRFWRNGDEHLRTLLERIDGQGVAGITPDDLARVYVATMRGEGRRASAAKAALKGLQDLVHQGKDKALAALKEELRVARSERKDWRERAERAEGAEKRWAERWERELSKARDEGREQARREWSAEKKKEEALAKRVADGLRDLGGTAASPG